MLGSTFSTSGPNIVLNTAVAEVLRQFADRLEATDDFVKDMGKLIRQTIRKHSRIIFNGNGYDESWVEEAARRGLSNLKSTPEALPAFITPKSIELFERHNVFSEGEIHSRYEIFLDSYAKTIPIEAMEMTDIVNREIIPAVIAYQNELAQLITKTFYPL